jgi:hypothetical protein
MWWWAEVSAVDQRLQPRLGAAASSSLAVADVQLAEPAQLPAHVVQVEHAELVDPQADVGLQPWGNNTDGQLGNGTTTNSDVPVAVTGMSAVKIVAAGGVRSLAEP